MKKSKLLCVIFLLLCAIVLRFVFSGHDFIAYTLLFVDALIVIFNYCKRFVKVLVALLVALGLVYFVIVEIPIVGASAGSADNDADYLIVLGAAVHGDTPSLALTERLEAAKLYLDEHPNAVAVVTGGQGGGENISEADCMASWLISHGIASDRVIKEDKATSTYENLKFSKAIIDARGGQNAKIAVVSSEYHLCRAKMIAQNLGMDIKTVSAHTTYFTVRLNYFIREAFGVTYQLVYG